MGAGSEILTEMRALRAEVAELKALLLRGVPSSAPAAAPGIAPDSDLDSQWGDVEVKKDPKRWKGAPQAPCRMSTCPPDYLDELASFLDWKAGKDDEEARTLDGEEAAKKAKYAGYARKDAARARGWAARNRAKPPIERVVGSDDGW